MTTPPQVHIVVQVQSSTPILAEAYTDETATIGRAEELRTDTNPEYDEVIHRATEVEPHHAPPHPDPARNHKHDVLDRNIFKRHDISPITTSGVRIGWRISEPTS